MYTKVWAHRGASADAPENTLEAFRLAADLGADGIELDVHLSADGEVVVIHDERIDRTSNGSGAVGSLTLAELRAFDYSNGMRGFKNCQIPTLREVYELIAPTPLHINVELKAGALPEPELIEQLARLEAEFGMEERLIYSSFNHYSLLLLKEKLPHAKIAPLYMTALAYPWKYGASLGAAALHPMSPNLLIPNYIAETHAHGMVTNVWTVDHPDEIKHMLSLGVDGIITNEPAMVMALRSQLQK